jgi:hypothetical protein
MRIFRPNATVSQERQPGPAHQSVTRVSGPRIGNLRNDRVALFSKLLIPIASIPMGAGSDALSEISHHLFVVSEGRPRV